jgi:hypothetical protein
MDKSGKMHAANGDARLPQAAGNAVALAGTSP